MRKSVLAYLFAATMTVPQAGFAQSHDQNAPSPPDTLAGWAKGAQLFDGLGSFPSQDHDALPLAQKYFDQGMRFIWAFNHDEATRSFAKAAMIDPQMRELLLGRRTHTRPQLQYADDELGARRASAGKPCERRRRTASGDASRARADRCSRQALSRERRS